MKIKNLIFVVGCAILLNSCGFFSKGNLSLNTHSMEAHINLSKKNFKVVDYVTGEAKTTYIIGIGGLTKRSMIEKARSEMYKNANLVGSSKVILNENIDFYVEHYPLVRVVKITVSGYVYEFTE